MTIDRLVQASSLAELSLEDLKYEDQAHSLFTIPIIFSLRGEISLDKSAQIQYLMGQVLFYQNTQIQKPSQDQMKRAILFMEIINDQNLDYTNLETLLITQMERLATKYPKKVDLRRFNDATNAIKEIFAEPR